VVDLAELERLAREGDLEPIRADLDWTRRMLDQGRLNVRSAGRLLKDDEPNVVGAVVLAWDGCFDVLAGLLNLAGYRVPSSTGHHHAAVTGVRALLSREWRPLLSRLGDLRRHRNRGLYDGIPADVEEVEGWLADVSALAGHLEAALRRAGAP
jgi:hypothetical protein